MPLFSSIAAVGFALTAYGMKQSAGSTRQEAAEGTLATLQSFLS